ncbi:hypothetical protein HPB49_025330 [Dermacentor silvarum]|uniref:Uncharacterized protein n=1 Tax=Dermacentor silvarum TaxID=543639 RepID=A0ACB8E3T2_DERSI|nr:hypothetical protein HPB49_025330 [Dermacentor silvarum]
MSAVTNSVCSLAGKFRGCLVGSLLGDCLGAPFEGDFPISKSVLTSYVSKLLDESAKGEPYSGLKFTSEYFEQPKRGYGPNVVDVFHALKKGNFEDPFGPAKSQFEGTGSYGNGGAMRVAEKQARITHTHKNGYNGAVLQCLAVHRAVTSDAQVPLNKAAFLDFLLEQMDTIESKGTKLVTDPTVDKPFTTSLQNMRRVLCDEPQDLSAEEVAALFGNDVSAHKSVPTAIYAFLRSHEPLPFFQLKARELACEAGVPRDTFRASRSWVQKFMRCAGGFLLRRSTLICQNLPAEYEEKLLEFQCYFIKMCWDRNYPIGQIGYVDETPIFLDISAGYVVDKHGTKELAKGQREY